MVYHYRRPRRHRCSTHVRKYPYNPVYKYSKVVEDIIVDFACWHKVKWFCIFVCVMEKKQISALLKFEMKYTFHELNAF